MSSTTRKGGVSRRAVAGGLVAVTAMAAATPAGAEDEPNDLLTAPEGIDIRARPISAFQRGQPHVKRFGQLEWRGGLQLTSNSLSFGGWSGLVIEPDGKALLSISDVGNWLSADVSYEAGRPVGLVGGRIGPLLAMGGRPLDGKHEQDAESVTLLEGTLSHGTLLIGFERLHRIGRFPIRDREVLAPTGYLKLPPDAKRMSRNQGIEALTVLKAGPLKGSVVAFAERLTRGTGYHTGWIWVGGDARAFHLKDIDGFNITDAAALPDGGMLVLERRFRWLEGVKMRLRRLFVNEIAPGARLSGRILFEGDSSYEIDNMEGVSVHRGAQGETVVSLISDDNFNHLLQQTIFLQFTLIEE
jgi:hypothetical protein